MKLEYNTYKFNPLEVISMVAGCLGITVIVSLLFYDSFWGIAASPFIYVICSSIYRKSRIKARKDQLTGQFIDALKSIGNAMSAGYSMENAIPAAIKDLSLLYDDSSCMIQELKGIYQHLKMNENLEDLFLELGERY